MIGKTEAQLTAEGVPYEIGVADFTVRNVAVALHLHHNSIIEHTKHCFSAGT
jgi:hypothetical protein